jgi:hypothetical protein
VRSASPWKTIVGTVAVGECGLDGEIRLQDAEQLDRRDRGARVPE